MSTARARTALRALQNAGGRSTVYEMVKAGYLPGGDGGKIGWGLTFAALERRGRVQSTYQMDEPAGSSKVWEFAEARPPGVHQSAGGT